MNKLEITIDKVDELITALTRLAEVWENKQTPVPVMADAPTEAVGKEEPSIAPEHIEPPAKEEKPITVEQVRAIITAKVRAGKKDAIQELLKRYGTVNVTKLDPAKYADFLKEAEGF